MSRDKGFLSRDLEQGKIYLASLLFCLKTNATCQDLRTIM